MILTCSLTFAICAVSLVGDKLLNVISSDLPRALTDSSTHGTIGLLTWALVVLNLPSDKFVIVSKYFDVSMSGLIAAAIDLDHFFLAKSLSLKKALHLEKRPILHCTSLWVLIVLACFTVSKVAKVEWLTILSWLLAASSLSHHIRDATRRGLWFWPIGSTAPIPYFIYIALLAVLPFIVKEFMKCTMKRCAIQNFNVFNV